MKKFEWIFALIKLNWANTISHKKSFFLMMLSMLVQNLIYFSMWIVIFSKISSLRGWGVNEVAFLFASGAAGYGIIFTFLGGMNQLGYTIQSGELDAYLGRPKSPLVLVLFQRMRADSIGDVLTGIVMLALWVHPPVHTWPLLFVLCLSSGLVFASFRLITHSLAFWGLGAETSENSFTAFLITATNPQKGFGNAMKLALLTVFPAGYIGFLPVEIIRNFRWDFLAIQLGGAILIFLFSLWLFHIGLRRYSSGNKFLVMR